MPAPFSSLTARLTCTPATTSKSNSSFSIFLQARASLLARAFFFRKRAALLGNDLAPKSLQLRFRILPGIAGKPCFRARSEEHTSELQSLAYLVCRLLLEKKNKK